VATDQPHKMRDRLQSMTETPIATRRLRLLALRKVLQQHTYAQRMQLVATCVLGESRQLPAPFIVAVARVHSQAEAEAVLANHRRQRHRHGRLLLVAGEGLILAEPLEPMVEVIRETDAATLQIARDFAAHYLALLHPHDYYGAHYLTDLALATQYSKADFIGKGSHYRNNGGNVVLVDGPRYRDHVALQPRACLARCSALLIALSDWLDHADVAPPTGLSIDEFSYCRDGANHADLSVDVDAGDIDTGADIAELIRQAETLPRSAARGAGRRARAGEINAGGADFRATTTRNRTLLVAESARQLDVEGAENCDRFLCNEKAARSFLEIDSGEVMQGDLKDLDDLLSSRAYATIWLPAPGASLSAAIGDHAAFHAVRVRLTDADLTMSSPPWAALLQAGYPRLKVVLDGPAAVDALAQKLGQRLPDGFCEFT
jgi:hypothetical protein